MYELSNGYLGIKVKSKGAELASFMVLEQEHEFMWQADPKVWGKHAPILFPIVGMLKSNYFQYEETAYHLGRHGFARDLMFKNIQCEGDQLVFELCSSAQTLKMYPFQFKLQIIYRLLDRRLEITYKVTNEGPEEMYFSIGAHPAFNCDLSACDAYLKFIPRDSNKEGIGSLKALEISKETGLITDKRTKINWQGNQLNLDKNTFKNDALIFEGHSISSCILGNAVKGDYLKLDCPDFEYIGIWSSGGDFVCIEPWHGIADFETSNHKIEEKKSIRKLASNDTFECIYSIEPLTTIL